MNISTFDDKVRLCKLFNIQEKQFFEDVDCLRKWVSEQPHLPKIELNDYFIGNLLIRYKFSIARTKQALDMFFTIHRLFPELYKNKHPKILSKEELYDDNFVIRIPDHTESLQHIIFISISKPKSFNVYLLMQKLINSLEFASQNGFHVEEIYVIDLKNILLEDLLKFTPSLLMKSMKIGQNIYKTRTKSAYFINNRPYVDSTAKLIKTVIKDKVLQRIHFDVGYDCLSKALPKDIIPKDYGGDGPSLKELSHREDVKLFNNSQFFDTIANLEVNEELRPQELLSNVDDIFGVHGTFKQLNLD